ncbi:MAG: archease [Thermoprotei archaeon]|nr:MAG: archease [Thermoprotei archaeon]
MGKFKQGYEFLEHTADAYIAAYGKDLNEAFENAAKAMFDVMTDVNTIEPKEEISVEVEAEDLKELLHNWLEALLLTFDEKRLVFSEFKVNIEKLDGGYRLRGVAKGEPFNPDKHPPEVEVKAITYSLMEIKEDEEGAYVKFVLDI